MWFSLSKNTYIHKPPLCNFCTEQNYNPLKISHSLKPPID